MVSLERLLGDEIYYYDDVESFVIQVRKILVSSDHEGEYRSVAERFDWSALAHRYEDVLRRVTSGFHKKEE